MNRIYIEVKLLLTIALLAISITYYMVFSYDKILEILKGEYISISIIGVLIFCLVFFKIKLKNYDILHFLPNINHVPLLSSIAIFLVFEIIDYFYEDGFIGMISLWFTYWCFALLAYLLTININLYKNLRFYKYNKNTEG